MKFCQSQHQFWLPVFSAAIYRPAGYKAAGIGALANPSALSNFADCTVVAMQFSSHSILTADKNVRPEALNERFNDRMFKSHQRAVLPSIIKVIRN